MDPRNLPAAAQAVYEKIRQGYKVSFEPLQLGAVRLNLLMATDLEQLLEGKDPLKNPQAFPFWIKLWEASLVLGRFLVERSHAPGTRVLELGAGLGAPGLAAAAAGYQVTLSDYEPTILEFEQVSAAASGIPEENVAFRLLDWKNPPVLERHDLVIGAEVLFREEFFAPLLTVIDQSLQPDGEVLLAHDSRRRSLKPFLEMAQDRYAISMSKKRLRNLEEDREILLTRLVRKK